jgi:hypothetical protein
MTEDALYAETLGALDLLELVLYVDSVTDDTTKGVGTAIPAPILSGGDDVE